MMKLEPRRGTRLHRSISAWVAAAVCAALVLAAGSRLVVLSMRQYAAQAHTSAQLLADRAAQSIQSQLQALEHAAQERAALAANARPGEQLRSRLLSIAPRRESFWLTPDGAVLGADASDREAASVIAANAAAQGTNGAAVRLLGPVRQANRWLVAFRAPIGLPTADGNLVPQGWAVTYRDVNELLLDAQLDRTARAGYDFELSGFDPDSRATLALMTTSPTPLASGASAAITLAPQSAGPAGSSAWRIAIRPRAGWFPTTDLVVDVSLLILVTWLVALGVRDLMHQMTHLRSALDVSRERLQRTQRRLAQEVELRQRTQKTLDHAHHHDAFTGLPNRQYFIDQLDRALRDMRTRASTGIALMLIRVDRFKVITDTLGHTAGDELMLQITRLFEQTLSTYQHVTARWTEDELALLLIGVPDTQGILETAHALQQALRSPIELRRHRVAAVLTMGATHVESGLKRAEDVLREADIALSAARTPGQGGSSLVTYDGAMQAHLMQAVSLEADLQLALERDEFRLVFQPIVDLHGRHIVGVEALLRWAHPVEGLLRPDRFLRSAEEAGLIVPITRWIILTVCRLHREWQLRLPPTYDFYVSVNLSPSALLDPGLPDYVSQMLAATHAGPSSLKFELTESGLISNVSAARGALDQLRSMGIELMLDDFGTGYSSLSHLQLFPFDYIKIDGPFDNRRSQDPSSAALVRAMTQMATTLGLKTIAEIVETTAAVATLEEMGCDFAQGKVFCAPIDPDEVLQRLRAQVLVAIDDEEELSDSETMILPVLTETMIY
jgi:diguanylate cyclase (GGDEF)-like protein